MVSVKENLLADVDVSVVEAWPDWIGQQTTPRPPFRGL